MDPLLDMAPCGFVAFLDDGTVVEVNLTLAEMLGYSRDELVGRHVDRILPPGGRIFYHTYLLPMLKVQERVDEIYLALRSEDGHDMPVLLNGIRREREGRFINDCICVRMIQRNEYEQQLLQARRLAEESNEAKAKFLSMMSHDLRSPLTTIHGNANLLEKEMLGTLNSEQMESVQAIRQACNMQMTMVTDLLDFARMESGRVQVQPGVVTVREAIARAEALLQLQVREAGLRMITSGCNEDVAVVADPDRLQQILLNLLTNAIKFTPSGGEISVSCRNGGDRGLIEVRDTGVGIDPEELPRIFSPFVQLGAGASPSSHPSSSRGVGLGLAICRDLARAMDGDVSAESTPGAGSCFIVNLPAASEVSDDSSAG